MSSRIDLRYPSDPRTVHEVRKRFEEFARSTPLSGEDVEDLKVALSEACANAICHGSPQGRRNHFHVTCSYTGDELVMEVADEGRGFIPSPSLPEESASGGRGIFLMRHLCDALEVEPRHPGTAVRMVKRMRRRPNGKGGTPATGSGRGGRPFHGVPYHASA